MNPHYISRRSLLKGLGATAMLTRFGCRKVKKQPPVPALRHPGVNPVRQRVEPLLRPRRQQPL